MRAGWIPSLLIIALGTWVLGQAVWSPLRDEATPSLGDLPIVPTVPPVEGRRAERAFCWPTGGDAASQLPELDPPIPGAPPPCPANIRGPVVLEAWDRARFVWRPGVRLELQRW